MILIADDHLLYRERLQQLLNSLEKECISTNHYDDLISILTAQHKLELLILNIRINDMKGVKGLRKICELCPGFPVLIISDHNDPLTIKFSLDAGASGYLSKSSSYETVRNSIQFLLNGQRCIPGFRNSQATPNFSAKQVEILYLLVEGYSNDAIAKTIFLSPGTVKQYVSDILIKLNVENRVQAAIRAQKILGFHP